MVLDTDLVDDSMRSSADRELLILFFILFLSFIDQGFSQVLKRSSRGIVELIKFVKCFIVKPFTICFSLARACFLEQVI